MDATSARSAVKCLRVVGLSEDTPQEFILARVWLTAKRFKEEKSDASRDSFLLLQRKDINRCMGSMNQ